MNLSSKYPRVRLLGVDVFALRMDTVLDIANEHIANRERLLIGVVNVAKIVNMRKNRELRASLEEADLVLVDGWPIVWLSRMLGNPLPERLAGIDIMYELLKQAHSNRYRVYFLGAEYSVLHRAIRTVQEDYPGIQIAGFRDGYFAENQERDVAESIEKSQPDILFVGISSPKKENFLRKWRNFMNVPVCHGVGGSFDILAGATKRAPFWIQKYGLEWLFRLMQEPRRMWKRYLVTNIIFIKLSLEAILRARLARLFRKSTCVTACNREKLSD